MNPFRPLADAGVTLAFGSDTTVSPMDPWPLVHAATDHRHGPYALDRHQSLRAAITGGRRAARQDDAGRLRPGQRADMAAFAEQRAGPCERTVVAGRVVHGAVGVEA
jgi:predicted amidohydrolase YtcJ